MNDKTGKLIVVTGPTAAGKTKLAAELCFNFHGEIISADSRQVYSQMDIGTGKDYSDYIVNNISIPYHLIDIVNPDDEFNLFLFKQHFSKAFSGIIERNNLPFLVGGTGLYIDSILHNYDLKEAEFSQDEIDHLNALDADTLKDMLIKSGSSLHNTTDLNDKQRLISAIIVSRNKPAENAPRNNTLVIGVNPGRDEVKKRITLRLKRRLSAGMIEEVETLIKSGITYEKLNFFGLEYKFLGQYLEGKLSYNDMFQKLNSAIHGFAKRQMTWFRKMEREGITIHWIDKPDAKTASALINDFIESKPAVSL